MEESGKTDPIVAVAVSVSLVVIIGVIGTKLVYHATGITATYSQPILLLVPLLAIYPFIKRVPTRPGRKPLTFPRWALRCFIGAICIFVAHSLIDIFF